MRVISDACPVALLCENVTSYAKPEVHKASRCRQMRTSYVQVTCKGNIVKCGRVILGGLFDTVDLIKPVSNVRPSTKRFFHFNEIWHVRRGLRVTHDGIQYDPIKVKVKVTQALQSWKSGRFQKLSPPPFTIGAGN